MHEARLREADCWISVSEKVGTERLIHKVMLDGRVEIDADWDVFFALNSVILLLLFIYNSCYYVITYKQGNFYAQYYYYLENKAIICVAFV